MIQETIVITQNSSGVAHIAPMGIHVIAKDGVYAASQPGAGAALKHKTNSSSCRSVLQPH